MSASSDNPVYTGLVVGHERGQIDRLRRVRRRPEDLWLPAGASAAFVAALREGYLKGLAGEEIHQEDFDHA